MAEHIVQLANELGLLGLADRVNAKVVTVADFDAAVSHIEGILQRDNARLAGVTVMAKDKALWDTDYRPKLQQAFQHQLQAVAEFHAYAKHPAEAQLIQGIQFLGQANALMQSLEGMPEQVQAAV